MSTEVVEMTDAEVDLVNHLYRVRVPDCGQAPSAFDEGANIWRPTNTSGIFRRTTVMSSTRSMLQEGRLHSRVFTGAWAAAEKSPRMWGSRSHLRTTTSIHTRKALSAGS